MKLLDAAKRAREVLRNSISATCGEAQEFGGDMTDRIAFDALDAAIEEAEKIVIPKEFEEWWDKNEKQYTNDSCHMSEFHMANVVWKAATEAKKEKVQVTPQGFQINIPIVIPRQRIADVLCSAFEGGSNYWYLIVDYTAKTDDIYKTIVEDPKHEQWIMVGDEGYPRYAALPLVGGVVKIRSDDDPKIYTLDEAAIKRGLSVLAIKHLNDILEGNDDADTADIFLQCCLFGEVQYG